MGSIGANGLNSPACRHAAAEAAAQHPGIERLRQDEACERPEPARYARVHRRAAGAREEAAVRVRRDLEYHQGPDKANDDDEQPPDAQLHPPGRAGDHDADNLGGPTDGDGCT